MYAKDDYDLPLIVRVVRNSNSLKVNSRRNYSTLKNKIDEDCVSHAAQVDPWFITGFADAEGSYVLSITKSNELKSGWIIKPRFQISLHKKDLFILEAIKKYLGL